MAGKVVGLIGGGQLARMMVQNLDNLPAGLVASFVVLDPAGVDSPAGQLLPPSQVVQGSVHDAQALAELAGRCDVLTFDVEHVSREGLQPHASKVVPSLGCHEIICDKLRQKQWFSGHGVPVVGSPAVDAPFPWVVKARKGGYNGQGVVKVDSREQYDAAVQTFGGEEETVVEETCEFTHEVSCMVLRLADGSVHCFPVVEVVTKSIPGQGNVCHATLLPSSLATRVQDAARDVATRAVASLPDGSAGVFGVEMFVELGGAVKLNEIAMRPHNTGHYTEAAFEPGSNQFSGHVRAVCGDTTPPNLTPRHPACISYNLFGEEVHAEPPAGATYRKYGKKEAREHRKMGHVNLVADTRAEVVFAALRANHGIQLPAVGVIMGSTSDFPVMRAAVECLRQHRVPVDLQVVSAHRTPREMYAYADKASSNGLRLIIAGAGGAAHLPGMVASLTDLPVIGVPVKSRALSGLDSLLSIVQMPRGVPVLTMAIDGAENAARSAIRILRLSRLPAIDVAQP